MAIAMAQNSTPSLNIQVAIAANLAAGPRFSFVAFMGILRS